MRIEIDLPSWVDERAIHIMAGVERVAYKLPWEEKWKVKTSRCDMCGACCSKCKSYVDNKCTTEIDRPFLCCVTHGKIDACSIGFREV